MAGTARLMRLDTNIIRILLIGVDADPSTARDALRRTIISIDRAHTGLCACDPGGVVRAWCGLVDGRWWLVDRFDHGERRFLVARGSAASSTPRALSQRQRQIAACVALGHSNKEIAYALGLAPSTVSSHLRSAMRRLGVRDSGALADIFFVHPVDEDDD